MTKIKATQTQNLCVMSLDIGSSSVRAMVFDAQGRAVRGLVARETYELDDSADGGVTADPEAMMARVERVVDALLKLLGDHAQRLQAVGISTFWHSLLGVDDRGKALTPVLTWADTRSAAYAARLRHELDERQTHARTGCVLHPSYWPAKLRWLAHTQPEVCQQVTRWVSLGEYIHYKLFGTWQVSLSMASGTGLLNPNTATWDAEMLAAAGIPPDQLSPLSDVTQPLSGLCPLYAQRWPALAHLPWFPAVGDGACSNVGSGCVTPQRVAVMIGTSGAMRVITQADQVQIPWGVWCYLLDRHHFVLGGALSEGGNLFAWLRETLQLPNTDALENELRQMQPDGHGLTVLPFLAGERSPGWVGHARAAFVGLSLHTRPIDMLQAAMEAVAYRFGLIFELLQNIAASDCQIIASGGALLNSPVWVQMIADVLGRPLIASAEPEVSSRGAALVALRGIGALDPLDAAPAALGQTYQPNTQAHAIYQQASVRQRELYGKLITP